MKILYLHIRLFAKIACPDVSNIPPPLNYHGKGHFQLKPDTITTSNASNRIISELTVVCYTE
jgi:hypothetical protein